jgi:multidrug efflux pump subunit AcrA (membrane-fusion protein)
MATGQKGFDPDDFFDQRRLDYQREQTLSDRQRMDRERADDDARRALDEQRRAQLDANRARLDAMLTMVNDDDITLSAEEVAVVNDKTLRMMPNGEVVSRRAPGARDIIRRSGQFSRANILPNLPAATKRTRKKTKTDKNMSKALRMANDKFRTAKGKLRKGASQAQIMKYAHKLLKKM